MTIEALKSYIGRSGTILLAGVTVPVTIKDARACYGRIDLLVSAGGTMEAWKESSKVTLDVSDSPTNEIIPATNRIERKEDKCLTREK